MNQKFMINNKIHKIKSQFFIVIASIGLIISGGGLSLFYNGVANAADATIYNNIPSPLPGNLPSEAFEAQSASEFGGQVSFDGTLRQNPTVTVIMSSWGCQSGHWYSNDCSTTPGAAFDEPITLNIYAVNGDNSPGTIISTQSSTFSIPYRPSADTNCIGPNTADGYTGTGQNGEWYSSADNKCYNGLATPISFNLSGVSLPDKAIISFAYNTTHYGYSPIGQSTSCYTSSAGCGYDSLNVGLTAPPSVGSDPLPNDAYLYSSYSGAYCPPGTPIGTFRLDQGCWTGYQPAIKVTAQTSQRVGSVTGGLTLTGPRQQISFNAFDYGANSNADYGNVEYQNFDYVGGLHYTAKVLCATVSGNTARFMFQIPDGHPGLSGLYVVASVTDGGSPGKGNDTYGHTATAELTTAQNWCENGALVTNYTITGGNAVVHKQ